MVPNPVTAHSYFLDHVTNDIVEWRIGMGGGRDGEIKSPSEFHQTVVANRLLCRPPDEEDRERGR